MASVVEICNLALSHLGAYTINAITDASQEARKCKLFYPVARDTTLRGHPWNFAEKRPYLALVSGADPVGYEYAYEYPSDCHNFREIYNDIEGQKPIKFTITASADLKSKMVLTDQEDAIGIYTGKVEDPNVFDTTSITALSYMLASFLAQPIAKKIGLQKAMLAMYGAYMSSAVVSNASESQDVKEYDNPFIAARG